MVFVIIYTKLILSLRMNVKAKQHLSKVIPYFLELTI